jgi:2-(1,2-epoxy-1,2-dihydrophenyl)acetyl-CoA isomerase
MSTATLTVTAEGPVAVLRLQRPAKLNALDLALKLELAQALRRLVRDPDVRAVVLTGAGRAFCAGADLTDLAPEVGVAFRDRLATLQAELIELIASAGTPFVAAVNGPAVGGGFALAAACDVIVAAEGAFFSAPQIALGLAPDLGIVATLSARVGAARARALLLTGERLPAATAREWGLVHDVVPADELDEVALELASGLACASPPAIAATKRLFAVLEAADRAALLAAEAAELSLLRLTPEHASAVAGFRARADRRG